MSWVFREEIIGEAIRHKAYGVPGYFLRTLKAEV
jgi:hypothetical protein